MKLIASEESTTFYEFDESVLEEYKDWAKTYEKPLSKTSFTEFIFDYNDIEEYEIDTDYSGDLKFRSFNEWINQ